MTLTSRQRECLALAARGYTNREIGLSLGLSPSTAKQHVQRAMSALGARDRTHAAVLALTRGEIEGVSV